MTPGGQFNAEESHPNHKLTKQDIIDIRTRYNNQERKNEVYEQFKNSKNSCEFTILYNDTNYNEIIRR